MTLENNFIIHSTECIFSDNKILSNRRESVFKKIFQKNYDKKNNESLKNITITDLSKFDYFYKPIKEDPTVSLIDDLNYEIKLVNGICKNYEDDSIEIRNITNLDFKSFLNQDKNNLVPILPNLKTPRATIYFTYPPELKGSKKIEALRDFLVREVNKEKKN